MPDMRPSSSHRTSFHFGFLSSAGFLRLTTPLLARWHFPPVLPTRAPAIFVANHRSLFDVVVGICFFAHFKASVRILVAGKYFADPLLGRLLRLIGAIPVDGTGLLGLKEALGALDAGESVVIMPEGRIVSSLESSSGVGLHASGVGLLVQRSGAPVVLCAITGSDEVWPSEEKRPRLLGIFSERPLVSVKVAAVRPIPSGPGRSNRKEIALEVMSALAEFMESS